MVVVGPHGVWAKLSAFTMRHVPKKDANGVEFAVPRAIGMVRIGKVDLRSRSVEADFASEALSTIVARLDEHLVDVGGAMFFIPHGASWDDQIAKFMRNPEDFEAIHPRMMRAENSYLYVGRNVFVQELR